jgi:putative CocE/NonD family hydrolase
VGGWFDAEDLAGPFRTYAALKRENPGLPVSLAVGPWSHGAWSGGDGDRLGDVSFGSKTAEYFRREIEFPFFEYHLKGRGAPPAPVIVFETGTNEWRQPDRWPPVAARRRELFLHRGGRLDFEPPADDEGDDVYVSDPFHPVPFTSYITSSIPTRFMLDDQRFAAQRPDVLVYETDPLGEDVAVAGPVTPRLFVASSGTDSDFVVKLIDVYPPDMPDLPAVTGPRPVPAVRLGGYQQLIRGEPFRAKFRRSFEKPEPLVPGRVERVEFAMPDVNHTFRRGHRIMVQIQSSWFPLVDRNPQTFVDIPAAKPADFQPATETVFHSRANASALEINVLNRE